MQQPDRRGASLNRLELSRNSGQRGCRCNNTVVAHGQDFNHSTTIDLSSRQLA